MHEENNEERIRQFFQDVYEAYVRVRDLPYEFLMNSSYTLASTPKSLVIIQGLLVTVLSLPYWPKESARGVLMSQ